LSTKSGEIVSALLVSPDDKLQLVTVSEQSKPLAAKSLPSAARTNAGKAIIVLAAGEQVARAVLLPRNGLAPEPPAKRGHSADGTSPSRTKKAEPVPAKAAPKPRAGKATETSSETTPAAGKSRRGAGAVHPAAEPEPVADADEVIVRRGKPAEISAQTPPEEVMSRRGQPASMARPTGKPADNGGQMLLVPDETSPAPAKPKTAATDKPAKTPTTAADADAGQKQPAPKTAATQTKNATTPKTTTKATPAQTPPAKTTKAPTAKEPATGATDVKPPASRSKRTPEAEFEPKPKGASSSPPKTDAPGGLQTTWSPSPPRAPEEPE
jgi:hypothetical protein